MGLWHVSFKERSVIGEKDLTIRMHCGKCSAADMKKACNGRNVNQIWLFP